MMREASLTELARKVEARGLLWSASLGVTHRCNETCVHCLRAPTIRADLDRAVLLDVLDQLHDLGCFKVTLTGGEPFMRRDLLDILAHARAYDIASDVLTNGTLITRRIAEALPRLGVLEVQVSVYGASADVHDGVTRTPGSFRRTLRGLTFLREAGVRCRVTMPVLRENAADFDNVRAMCARLDVPMRWNAGLFPREDGGRQPLMHLTDDRQLVAVLRSAAADGDAHPAPVEGAAPLCGAGVNRLDIDADGVVHPCGAFRAPLGNVRVDRLADIWRASPVLQHLRQLQRSYPLACAACQARPTCFWCPGLSLALGHRLDVPNDQDCRRTRLTQRGQDHEQARV
jgi:AdoMet-dependent heme synthase